MMTLYRVNFNQGFNFNNLVIGLLNDAACYISKHYAMHFWTKRFFNVFLYKYKENN